MLLLYLNIGPVDNLLLAFPFLRQGRHPVLVVLEVLITKPAPDCSRSGFCVLTADVRTKDFVPRAVLGEYYRAPRAALRDSSSGIAVRPFSSIFFAFVASLSTSR